MEDHIVLYRQYRPVTFDDVVGQEAAVTAIRQSVVSKKLAHAYLFCGQHGTGKTTIAKIFARAVNCEHPVNGNPCNECAVCKGILDGSILDVTEMDAASNNGVDDIRPILQEVNFAPTRTTYKVYIIDEVHMLSKGAFNALLKTIEEPPKHVIFIFATTESDKIPATIISRCQRYDFKRIPLELISGRLRDVCSKSGIKATDDALRLIASRSDGALRDALSLLDQISAISGSDNEISSKDVERITGTVDSSFLFKMANCLIDARFDELIDLCEMLNSSGKNQARFTLDLAAYFRDLLIIRVKADPVIYLPYPKETIKDMYQTAAKVSADTLTGYISYLSKEYAELRKSPDIPTSFELMLMRLCGRKSSLPVTPIVIPDFEKKQAEKAAEITLEDKKTAVETGTAKEPQEDKKEDTDKDEGSSSEIEPGFTAPEPYRPKPSSTPEPFSPKPAAVPEPYRPKPSVSPSSTFTFTSLAKGSSVQEKTEESTPVAPTEAEVKNEEKTEDKADKPSFFSSFNFTSSFTSKTPEPEEPEDDGDSDPDDTIIPADDSFRDHTEPSIVSFIPKETDTESKFSFNFDEPEEPEDNFSYEPDRVEAAPAAGIFSGLSSSFLKDLEADTDSSKAEAEEPEETVPVKPRSQLAVQADRSGLIVDGRNANAVRSPSFTGEDADIALRWSNVTSKIKTSNDNIAVILEHTNLRKNGNSAYIVFEDKDSTLLSNLKKSQAFRQISSGIKDEFGAEHLYLCTEAQYSKQMEKERANELDKKLDDLNERSRNMGVPTDVHFGD
ncbi:MAG: DNA polymerase III subunit gamma/tau [Saccharofermentans sp.]|nr:DNA polymerase III subunit gamma/tau [Saccharofermentans sp.]